MMVNIKYRDKDCTYCGTKMKIAKIRVKRAVPPGAKDLNLFNEFMGWKCPRCERIDAEEIERCSCGSYSFSHPWIEAVPPSNAYEEGVLRFQAKLSNTVDTRNSEANKFSCLCTACAKCAEYAQPLNTLQIESEMIDRVYDKDHDRLIQWRMIYYHKPCFAKNQSYSVEEKRRKEENKRRLEEEDIERRMEEARRYFKEHGS